MITQQHILRYGIKSLDEFGIRVNEHDDGRIILNYCQIDSQKYKFEKIVRECRSLVLNSKDNYNLISRGFYRFFNWSECIADSTKFIWEGSRAEHKEDGSYIQCFYWDGQWRVHTKNSFGEGCINEFITWKQLFELACPVDFFDKADTNITYVFELCSKYNKVVREYNSPTLFLLSCFSGEHELHYKIVNEEAKRLKLSRPSIVYFNDIKDAESYIANVAKKDKTFEGIVLIDKNNIRIKYKNDFYLLLHKKLNNGNYFNIENLVHHILTGEVDEMICYFPEMKEKIEKIEKLIDLWRKHVDNLWYCYHDEKSQKKFALAVKDSPLSSILFNARKTCTHPLFIFGNYSTLIGKLVKEQIE